MKISTKFLSVCLACAGVCSTLSAQEGDFDLSSQRSESQHVSMVPGEVLDHQGIIINPTPQTATFHRENMLRIADGVCIKDKQKKFTEDVHFLPVNPKGTRLTIDFGEKAAAKQGVEAISGAYALSIGKNGIAITGYDERGAFYGLQTLRQLTESPVAANGEIPYAEINDYPDLPQRGVVEGFYGTPWSHEVRLSLIDFYGKFKMNTYIYGPKDDPYHSSPNWRLPYPENEARNIKELIEACRKNRVDFVWAIHPGQDIKWNDEDYKLLLKKFNNMYALGVRVFAIFFDDISGEGTNPYKQTELLNRLTKDFVEAKGDVAPLTVCPTEYTKLWANPTPQGSLVIYGKTLTPGINVFWTGDVVCSDLTRETLDFINSRIKRPAYYWWNFPVTDYARHIVMQGPTYGLDTSLTSKELHGMVSNPMEHGEASKLALYGVADYTWNIADYNPMDNWERGLAELMPKAKEAYRTFAIHSCDTETGYRRDESWETETFRLAEWDDSKAGALQKEFEKIEKVPQEIEKGCTNTGLLKELRPWLTEFGKLGTRGKNVIELARIYRNNDSEAAFWNKYVTTVMSPEERKQYNAHKSGTLKLQPFYENMINDLAFGFLERISGETPKVYKSIGTFRNIQGTGAQLMFDDDPKTFYTSGVGQKANDWIGVDLRTVREVSEVYIEQGRNSTDDVDYFDHAVVEYSEDGKEWSALTDELKKQYVIHWNGTPVKARYIRLKRLDSKRKNYAAIRTFKVNPLRPDNIGFAVEAPQSQAALYAFDANLHTQYASTKRLKFDVPEGTTGYTVLTQQPAAPVKCTLWTADDKLVSETVIDTPYTTLSVAEGTAYICMEGEVEIVEIVPHKK